MNLFFCNSAEQYKSNSQKIRVLSEGWFSENMYCPCCGNLKVEHFENNKPVADFYCEKCKAQFELKSTSKSIKNKITDGAYATAIQRLTSNTNPDLFVLQYNEYVVNNLVVIPRYFFTPDIIEKRKPLAETARRAGWVGSNILFNKIPEQGIIYVIKSGKIIDIESVVSSYKNTASLRISDINARGWLIDILNCVNSLQKDEFELSEIYQFESALSVKHPDNNNIRPKIRQQLQELRDRNILQFLGNGKYKKVVWNKK